MKQLFVILALVSSSLFMSSYANENKANPVVEQVFQNAFAGAKDISWEQVGVLYKATFVLDGQYRSAFYNTDGDLLALTKNMSLLQLPKPLQTSLKKELQGVWITGLFAVSINGYNTYYVTLENADATIVLKSAGSKKWAIYRKAEK